MILGMGSDMVDIRRIERTLERFGARFVERVFTPQEQARAEPRANRAAAYAKRFAAKEACAKALGTGISQEVFWRDMGVVNDEAGRPGLLLCGGAQARLAKLTPPGYISHIHLTLTDEPPYAQALVILTAVAPSALPS